MKKIIELVKLNKYNTSAQKALKTISDLSLIIRERESYGIFSLNDEELKIVSDVVNTEKNKVFGSVVFDDDFISGEKHSEVLDKVNKEIQYFNWLTIAELKSKKSIYEALVGKIQDLNISQKESVDFLVKWYKYKDVYKFKMVNSFLDRNLKYLEYSQSKINDFYTDFNTYLDNFKYNNAISFTENYNKLFYEAFYRKNNVWKSVIDRLIQTQNNCMTELEMYSEQYNAQMFSDEEKEFGLAQIKFNEHKKIVEDFECLELLINDIEKARKNKIEMLMSETKSQFEALVDELHESYKYYSKLFELHPNSNNSIICHVIKEHIIRVKEGSETVKMLHTSEVVELLTFLREKLMQQIEKYLDVFTAKFSKLSESDQNNHEVVNTLIDDVNKTIHISKYDFDYYVELSKKNNLEINIEFNEKIAELKRNTKHVGEIKLESEKEELNKQRTIYTTKVDTLLGNLNSDAVAKAKMIENISESFASAENDAVLTKIYKKFDDAVELLRTQAKIDNVDADKVEEFENLLTSCITFDELYEDKLDVIYENFVKLEYLYQVEKGTPNVIRKVAQSFIQESDAIRVLEFVGMRPEKSLQNYDALTDKDKISAVFAYMLVSNPKLLVIEENDLWETPGLRQHFVTLMKNAQAHKALGVLYVGNNIDAMLEITEKTMIMHNGKIIEYGDSRLLANKSVHIYTKDLFNKKSMLYENVHNHSSDSEVLTYAREYSEVDAPQYRKVSENHFVYATEHQFESWLRNEKAKVIKADVVEENLMHADMEVMIPTLPTVLVEKNIEETIAHAPSVEKIIKLEKKHENVAVNTDHISEEQLQEMIKNAEYVEEFDESTVVYGKNLSKAEAMKLLQAQVEAQSKMKAQENNKNEEATDEGEVQEITPLEKEIAKEEIALHKREEKIEELRDEYSKEDVSLVENLIKKEIKLIAEEITQEEPKTQSHDNSDAEEKRIKEEELEKERKAEEKRLEKERERQEEEKLAKDKEFENEKLEKEQLLEKKRLEKKRLEEELLAEDEALEEKKRRAEAKRREEEELENEKLEKEQLLEKKRLEKKRLEEELLAEEELLEEKKRLEKEVREEKQRIEELRLEKARLEKERLEEEELTAEIRKTIEKRNTKEKRHHNDEEDETEERTSKRKNREDDDDNYDRREKRSSRHDEYDERDDRDYISRERHNDINSRQARDEDRYSEQRYPERRYDEREDRDVKLRKREEDLYERRDRIVKRRNELDDRYSRDSSNYKRSYKFGRRDDERDERDYRSERRYDEFDRRDSRYDEISPRRYNDYDERDDREKRRETRNDKDYDERRSVEPDRQSKPEPVVEHLNQTTTQVPHEQQQPQAQQAQQPQAQPAQQPAMQQPVMPQQPQVQQVPVQPQVVLQYPQPRFYYQQAPQYHPPIIHPLPGDDAKILNTMEFMLDKKLLEAERRSYEESKKSKDVNSKGEVLNNKLIKKLLKEVEDLEKTITLKLGE